MLMMRAVPSLLLGRGLAMLTLLAALTVISTDLHAQAPQLQLNQSVIGGFGLFSPSNMAVSADGNFVYLASSDSVYVFRRDAGTSRLMLASRVVAGIDGVRGLDGASDIVIAPGEQHVYVTAVGSDAVTAFSRDANTGALSFIEIEVDGANGVDGLGGASHLIVSPDGLHVYATGRTDDAVAVFSRNTVTGELTFIEQKRNGVDGVSGLESVTELAISADGNHLYTVAFDSEALVLFSRDPATGRLTFVEALVDGVDGLDGLGRPGAVAISADDGFVYAGSSSESALVVFARDASTGRLTSVQILRQGEGGVDGINIVVSIRLSSDDAHLYTTTGNGFKVGVFSRNTGTGQLSFVEVQEDGVDGVEGLQFNRGLILSPDGSGVYVTGFDNSFNATVVTFTRDAGTGRLNFIEALSNADIATGLAGVEGLAISPDGNHLYTASGRSDAIGVYGRNNTTGRVTFVETQVDNEAGVDGLEGLSDVALSPNGAHLYAAGTFDDALAVFSRDAGTGTLSFVEVEFDDTAGVDGLGRVRAVVVSPDGRHVYTAADNDDSVAQFTRNTTSGELTFITAAFNGVDGVSGINGATDVAISNDGAHVYVAGTDSNSIAVFNRNDTTGVLTFAGRATNGSDGIAGLSGPVAVVVSPGGNHVYAASQTSDALTVFSRNSATGLLTFIEFEDDGVGGVDGLRDVEEVTVNPDGGHVYAVSSIDDAVAVFTRDAGTGELTFVEFIEDGGTDGFGNRVGGIDGARSIAVSPNGVNVYVSGSFVFGALLVFNDQQQAPLDFGDAPDPTFPTLVASDGARHSLVSDLRLGAAVDADPDGQPTADSDGDDNDGMNDEDGVTFARDLRVNEAVDVTVTASEAAVLDGFVDFNRDGGWGEANEKVFDSVALAAGPNTLTITTPIGASTGATTSRFRVSTSGGLSFDGGALNGEVEDHAVTIIAPIEINFSVAEATAPEGAGANIMVAAIQLSQASTQNISFEFSVTGTATDGVDYTIDSPAASPVTINAGDTSVNVTFSILEDTDREGNETVIVQLSNPINAVLGAISTFTGTIADNDIPPAPVDEDDDDSCSGSDFLTLCIGAAAPVDLLLLLPLALFGLWRRVVV